MQLHTFLVVIILALEALVDVQAAGAAL